MLAVSNLGKYYGEQTLFEHLSVQFLTGERYGIVGANGSGKSTLLKILAGEELPSEGTVSMPKRARVGVLRQDHYRYEQVKILNVVMMGNAELWSAMEEKERLLEQADVTFNGDRYAELEDLILRHDGYTLESRAAEILEGLGIETERHHEPLSVLSGGFKLRVLLAQTLAAEPDLLLLDEPTNHLDIVSIRWLEKFLVESYSGCTLVVSHDHRFLDNVSTAIVDIDYGTGILYPGNYTFFERAKVEERERREKEIDKRQKEIADHQAFVDRFRAKATKARQAQSKIKLIEKINIEPLPQTSRRYPAFRFEQVRPSGKEVLTLEGVSKSYDQPVLQNVSLTVRRGERVAILGPNGIGKSTLLKIAMNQVRPDAGRAEWGYEARVGYFAQDHREQLGDSKQTVEAWLWEICPMEPIGFVRGQLAAVLFSGDEVKKKISSLSGGEAARLIFCRHMVEKPNVLVLDEPTNHLDLEAIDALVRALERYPGTLIFVSHDRWFVQRLATRVVEITKERIVDFQGSYDEYLDRCGDDHLDSEAVLRKAREAKRKNRAAAKERETVDFKELSKRRKQLDAELARVNQQIATAEARIHEINETFCDPTYFERTDPRKIRQVEQEQKDLNGKLTELLGQWQSMEEQLETLKESLAT